MKKEEYIGLIQFLRSLGIFKRKLGLYGVFHLIAGTFLVSFFKQIQMNEKKKLLSLNSHSCIFHPNTHKM